MNRVQFYCIVSIATVFLVGALLINESQHPLRVEAAQVSTTEPGLTFSMLGSYRSDIYDGSAAEIVKFNPTTQQAFVTNAAETRIDVLDLSDPSAPTLSHSLDIAAYGAGANSIDLHDDLLAVAVGAEDNIANGVVLFFDTAGELLAQVTVGPRPDMITFTPDGKHVLTANEGEPSNNYAEDPEGSISIIDLSGGVERLTQRQVRQADFHAFNEANLDESLRIYGPKASVAQDLEPEYITVSPDSKLAWVTLQENNGLAVVDITAAKVITVTGLGFKDWRASVAPSIASELRGLDASDRDEAINLHPWPVLGMYQPDTIVNYAVDGELYLVTANEGDARQYGKFKEEIRVKDLKLDPTIFPDAAQLQRAENLGRLTVSTSGHDTDGDGLTDRILGFGARSFAIWNAEGELIFESGSDFEAIVASHLPEYFNSDSKKASFDNRSDAKGGEPEALTIGEIDGRVYAFIGLERMSGVMVYEITDPAAPQFVTYVHGRDFAGNAKTGGAGDLAPEGMSFVAAADSPTGEPLLIIANEVSGSTTIWQITVNP